MRLRSNWGTAPSTKWKSMLSLQWGVSCERFVFVQHTSVRCQLSIRSSSCQTFQQQTHPILVGIACDYVKKLSFVSCFALIKFIHYLANLFHYLPHCTSICFLDRWCDRYTNIVQIRNSLGAIIRKWITHQEEGNKQPGGMNGIEQTINNHTSDQSFIDREWVD
jgi:hypothetical protein